jgi:hypothetical protein
MPATRTATATAPRQSPAPLGPIAAPDRLLDCGAVISEDPEYNMIRIKFPHKPSEQIRRSLGTEGGFTFSWKLFLWYAPRGPRATQCLNDLFGAPDELF